MDARKFKKFLHLSFSEKLWLAETFFTLLFAKLVIVLIPLRTAAKYFGTLNGQARDVSALENLTALRIKHFVLMVSGNVPWSSVCLDQALGTMILLRRRKIPSNLCLGVIKDGVNQKINAHAWIQCGDEILIGGQRSRQYNLIARFASQQTDTV